ncbi:hypothetical protein ACFW2Y_28765, partial [Streptomyces sp. NPDC058877]
MSHTEADLVQLLHTGPFHLALRTALAVRGLPLQRVQHHLAHRGVKVGVTSLSYWQQGARRPQRPESLKAVSALVVLGQVVFGGACPSGCVSRCGCVTPDEMAAV